MSDATISNETADLDEDEGYLVCNVCGAVVSTGLRDGDETDDTGTPLSWLDVHENYHEARGDFEAAD